MTPEERARDTRINVIILIAVVALMAWAIPARLQEARDADAWSALMAMQRR